MVERIPNPLRHPKATHILVLVILGNDNASMLMEKTGMGRRNLYIALKRLEEEKLIKRTPGEDSREMIILPNVVSLEKVFVAEQVAIGLGKLYLPEHFAKTNDLDKKIWRLHPRALKDARTMLRLKGLTREYQEVGMQEAEKFCDRDDATDLLEIKTPHVIHYLIETFLRAGQAIRKQKSQAIISQIEQLEKVKWNEFRTFCILFFLSFLKREKEILNALENKKDKEDFKKVIAFFRAAKMDAPAVALSYLALSEMKPGEAEKVSQNMNAVVFNPDFYAELKKAQEFAKSPEAMLAAEMLQRDHL